jgi:hypothetical protein
MKSNTGFHLAVSKLPRNFLVDLLKKIFRKKVQLSISKSVDIFSKVFKGFLGVFCIVYRSKIESHGVGDTIDILISLYLYKVRSKSTHQFIKSLYHSYYIIKCKT